MSVKAFDNLKSNKYYKMWFKDALPYITGAILLSVFQIVTLASTGNPWGVSGPLANWGAWIYQAFGGSVDKWYYLNLRLNYKFKFDIDLKNTSETLFLE